MATARKAIVIGGGLGGLWTALTLANRAVEVELAKPYREGTLVDAVLGVLDHA